MIQLVDTKFKEDIKKALDINFVGIKLYWDEGFKRFLIERMKRKKLG